MENFTFIPNHIDIQACLPFELMAGYTLRKATKIEIKAIDNHLKKMGDLLTPTGQLPYKLSYEFEQISENEIYISTEQLEYDSWKYYVVTHKGHGAYLHKYQLASNLMDTVLAFDLVQFEIHEGQYAFSYTPDLVFRFFSDNDITTKHQISLKNIEDLRWTFEKMCSIEESFHEIMNSIFTFNSLRYLPNYNKFKILGLFTVIESLITHKPSSKETGDSIIRQIKTKIPLLLNRIEGRIKYPKEFGVAKEETIWSKLYNYRSYLAHGNPADFENDGDIKLLTSPIIIHDFLTHCIKKLLVLALAEPRLIHDLKNC